MRTKLLWPPINLPLAWTHNASEWRGNLEWHLSALELSTSIISTRPYISWLQKRLCWLEWRSAFLLPRIVTTQTASLLDAYSKEKNPPPLFPARIKQHQNHLCTVDLHRNLPSHQVKKKGTKELRNGRRSKRSEGIKLYRDRIAEGLRQKDETTKPFIMRM